MAAGKTPGEDGVSSNFYKVIGARIREPRRDPATGEMEIFELLCPLATLMSEAFAQIHADGITPEGMRTTVISLLYTIQRKGKPLEPQKLPTEQISLSPDRSPSQRNPEN